jgi:hypothetical protein
VLDSWALPVVCEATKEPLMKEARFTTEQIIALL